MLYLRPATMEDSANLLLWRNDPETCANSRNGKPIPPRRHDLWMDINVRYGFPTRVILMAETGDNVAIGVVDFAAASPDLMVFDVSITMAPKMRGRGYGQEALALGCKRMAAKALKAEIKSENAASRMIFARCGFILVREIDGFAQFRKEPA